MTTSLNDNGERRAHPRVPVQISGSVTVRYLHGETCNIRDYCSGGMFIECDSISEHPMNQSDKIRRSDAVGIHFRLDKDGETKNFRLRARVARVFEGAMGVAFYNADTQTLEAINSIIGYRPDTEKTDNQTSAPVAAPKNQSQINNTVRAFVADQMQRIFQGIFVRFNDHLIHKASTAQTNQEQGDFFNGITVIKSKRAFLERKFLEKMIYEFDHIGQFVPRSDVQEAANKADQLTVVEKDEFEDWLVVRDIISKTEARYESELDDLTGRLYRLSLKPISNATNPVGPTVFFQIWSDVIEQLQIQHNVQLALYKVLGDTATTRIGELMNSTNKLLTTHGILPIQTPNQPASKHMSIPTDQPKPALTPHRGNGTPAASTASDYGQHGTASTFVPPGTPGTGAMQASGSNAPTGNMPPPTYSNVAANEVMQEAANIGITPSVMLTSSAHAYSTLQRLQTLRRDSLHYRPKTALEPVPENAPNYDSNEVVSVLSILQQEFEAANKDGRTTNLREWVLESLKQRQDPSAEKKQISEKQSDAIDVIERLFESMLASKAIPRSIKPCIRRLEVPILKVVLKDDSFFSDKAHPARQALNQLAKLAKTLSSKTGALNKPVEKTLDEVTKRVLNEFQTDLNIFIEVKNVLDKLVKRQETIYKQNIERVTKNYEGQQKVRQARRQVLEEINRRVIGVKVPRVILSLLYHGWRDLLVVTHIRKGMESHEWRVYLQVIDELLLRLSDNPDDQQRCKTEIDELLYFLRKGLEHVPGNQAENRKLLERVEELLAPDSDATPEMVLLDESTINDSGNDEFKQFATLITPESADEEPPEELSKFVTSIKLLKVGNWITLHLNAEEPERMNLAWIGEEHRQLVLVTAHGSKVLEMDLRQLAEHLRDGRAVIENELDLPPVDQGLYDMIQHIYQQLSHHTTHDPLTDLLNRKEFEKLLNKALQTARDKHITHALAYIDLDQFKILNNAYGHNAGDAFLKMISGLLKQEKNDYTHVARVSGDEFCMLIENIEPDAAKAMIEEKRKEIQSSRLDWNNDHLTSTASIGLVFVDDDKKNTSEIFQCADSACFAAKNAGRNRTVIYEAENDALHRQDDSMALAAKVNTALEENRLHLYGQTIAPVAINGSEKPRLEVLLTLDKQADLGISIPTFIDAAERYNRMTEIDRWVIKTSFEWMRDHKTVVNSMDHCAINLSGQSLNDESLLDYIVEQFSITNIDMEKVCFEITETTAIANLDNAADFVNKMKAIGCRFSLDDFGTGHASYAYLKRLPVDFLKIDGDFVRDIHTVPEDAAMVRSINEIAHYMGKKTIAEHVENDEILEMIREIGIDYAQGYGIDKPQPLESIKPYR